MLPTVSELLAYYNTNPELVRSFKHPDYPNTPYIGFDYTPVCQFSRTWNEYTSIARGLVIDIRRMKIVAKPFPKFMNLGEPGCDVELSDLNSGKFTAIEKVDGSLGIIFFNSYEGKWVVMTRGSFNSEQAKTAQAWIDSDIAQKELTSGGLHVTYLAEIIYPQNRIVVDYGDFTGLVLLGVSTESALINISDNDLAGYYTRNFKNVFKRIATTYKFNTANEMIDHVKKQDYNNEGVVVYLEDNRMCKIKGDDYCKVHKIKTNLTPKSVIEAISEFYMLSGKIQMAPDIMMKLPNEFWPQLESWQNTIAMHVNDQSSLLVSTIKDFISSIPTETIENRGKLMQLVQSKYSNDTAKLIIAVLANSIKLDSTLSTIVIPQKIINSWILDMESKLL